MSNISSLSLFGNSDYSSHSTLLPSANPSLRSSITNNETSTSGVSLVASASSMQPLTSSNSTSSSINPATTTLFLVNTPSSFSPTPGPVPPSSSSSSSSPSSFSSLNLTPYPTSLYTSSFPSGLPPVRSSLHILMTLLLQLRADMLETLERWSQLALLADPSNVANVDLTSSFLQKLNAKEKSIESGLQLIAECSKQIPFDRIERFKRGVAKKEKTPMNYNPFRALPIGFDVEKEAAADSESSNSFSPPSFIIDKSSSFDPASSLSSSLFSNESEVLSLHSVHESSTHAQKQYKSLLLSLFPTVSSQLNTHNRQLAITHIQLSLNDSQLAKMFERVIHHAQRLFGPSSLHATYILQSSTPTPTSSSPLPSHLSSLSMNHMQNITHLPTLKRLYDTSHSSASPSGLIVTWPFTFRMFIQLSPSLEIVRVSCVGYHEPLLSSFSVSSLSTLQQLTAQATTAAHYFTATYSDPLVCLQEYLVYMCSYHSLYTSVCHSCGGCLVYENEGKKFLPPLIRTFHHFLPFHRECYIAAPYTQTTGQN